MIRTAVRPARWTYVQGMTTAKSCISAVFASVESGRAGRPFQVHGDQVFVRVGPDWVIRSAKSSVPGGPRKVPESFWLLYPQNLAPTVSTLRSGFERCSDGRVVGEGRGGVELCLGDVHRPGHAVGSIERQRDIALSGFRSPAVGHPEGDSRCGRVGDLSDGPHAYSGWFRKADECVGRDVVWQRFSIPGMGVPRLVVGCGGLEELAVVDATGAPARTALPPVALTHPESRATATRHAAPGIGQIPQRDLSHAKRPAPVPFPGLRTAAR